MTLDGRSSFLDRIAWALTSVIFYINILIWECALPSIFFLPGNTTLAQTAGESTILILLSRQAKQLTLSHQWDKHHTIQRWPQMNSGVSKITCDQCAQTLHSIWFQHTEVTEVVCLVLCVCIKRITVQHYPRTYFQNYPSETVCHYLTPVRVQTRQPRTCLRLLGRQPRFHSPMPGQSGELCQWQHRSNLSVESQWILHIYIESDGL